MTALHGLEVAVIGMSGRFPGAGNIEEFWKLLKTGTTGISSISDTDLKKYGISDELLKEPNYVKKKGAIAGKERFDAPLFGYTASEAALLDPQFGVFHECVWEAFENSGYQSDSYSGLVGIYAGATNNLGWLNRIMRSNESVSDQFSAITLTSANLLSTRIAYAFGLTGPAIFVQTTCSTSLVAVHLACQGLITGECDIALAGAVSITELENSGYLYQEGMINSPDGVCRTFDADANGTVFGDGCGVVVLKLLENALEDRDNIVAIIKGSAINNDGNQKVGYTAPGVEGQLQVIRFAHKRAEVAPESISYMEAHGTATKLGDPIEMQALTSAFNSKERGFCKIGSVKSNIGHLDTAAGVAGMIKTILALQHKQIPPSLNFKTPNPHIDFENSPFSVNTKLCDWSSDEIPRRAGVSSFGIGGTNAHIVIEEACFENETSQSRYTQMVFLSANSDSALGKIEKNLLNHIDKKSDISLPDLCYTLHLGRKHLSVRKAFVVKSVDELRGALRGNSEIGELFSGKAQSDKKKLCFLFPGQGAQRIRMGKDLYEHEQIFRQYMDRCFEIAKKHTNTDFKACLYPESATEESVIGLSQTSIAQPIVFMFEYSLARVLMEWGYRPSIMVGHSVGEYVAACLSGVFSLEDALYLVIRSSVLIQALPTGGMLSVTAKESRIQFLIEEHALVDRLSIAAINTPSQIMISGDTEALNRFRETLDQQEIQYELLHTSHAFHSHQMEPILSDFSTALEFVKFFAPQIPFISNTTGQIATKDQVTLSKYWVDHMRQCVQFSKCVARLCESDEYAFLEVGPGRALSNWVLRNTASPDRQTSISLAASNERLDMRSLMDGLCQLYVFGFILDWSAFYRDELRRRISLPSYPFEGKIYHTQLLPLPQDNSKSPTDLKIENIEDWYYIPFWEPSPLHKNYMSNNNQRWLIFVDSYGVGDKLINVLSDQGTSPISVFSGDSYQRNNYSSYVINPLDKQQFIRLFSDLEKEKTLPSVIIHLWGMSEEPIGNQNEYISERVVKLGYYTQIYLAQALGNLNSHNNITIKVCANYTQKSCHHEKIIPEKSINLSPSRVIPAEYPLLKCQFIDCSIQDFVDSDESSGIRDLVNELLDVNIQDRLVAYRGSHRLVQNFKGIQLSQNESNSLFLRDGGNYLITGGLGGLGLVFSKYLIKAVNCKLLLLTRSRFIPKLEWDDWLMSHGPDDSISNKILAVKEMEKLGAKVTIACVDVVDEISMKSVVTSFVNTEGEINGVFHTAGLASQGVIQLKQDTEIEVALSAKVKGTQILRNVVPSENLDFMVLFSSQAALTGGKGEIDYCAGNLYLDAFAHCYDRSVGTRYLSINWPAWKETGMAVTADLSELHRKLRNEELGKFGISNEDGVSSFNNIFYHKVFPQVVVSPYSINDFIKSVCYQSEISDEKSTLVNISHSRPDFSVPFVPPKTEIEKKLAEIWGQLIGLDKIGINDNLFNLGADSLLYIRANNKIKNTLKIDVPLGDMLKSNTVQEQAINLEEISGSQQVEVPIESRGVQTAALSVQQMSRLVAVNSSNEKAVHNISSAFYIEGYLCVDSLSKAFEAIVRRHSSLRTVFRKREGKLVQQILEEVEFRFKKIDLSVLPAEERKGKMAEISNDDVEESFDLSKDTMLRAKLIKLSNEEYVLLISQHHIASDWWSMGIIYKELSEFYQTYVNGKKPLIPELPVQYIDYSLWQREFLKGGYLRDKLDYWAKVTKSRVKKCSLPVDNMDSSSKSYSGECCCLIDNSATKGLGRLTIEFDSSLFVILQAALVVFVFRNTKEENFYIGFNYASRTQEILEPLVGLFSSNLLLRSNLSKISKFSDIVLQVKEYTLAAIANQDAPIDLLAEEYFNEGCIFEDITCDITLTYRGRKRKDLNIPGLKITQMKQKKLHEGRRIIVEVSEVEEGLEFVWHYNSSIYKEKSVDKYMKDYSSLLMKVVKEPYFDVDDLKKEHTIDPTKIDMDLLD